MKPKDKIINTKILEVLFILLISLTPLLWLKGNKVVLGHDAGFRLNPLEHIKNLLYSWNPISNFGVDWSLFKGFLVAQVPETVFTSLTGSLSQGQKLSFIFWFFIMGISMYIFIKNFFPQKKFWIFRLFSSTFYMFNFFLLQAWFMTERAKFSLFAALPLGLLVLYKTLSREYSLLKGMVLFSFIFFLLNGGGSPANYGAIILTYSLAFFYLTFTNFVRGGLREIFFSIKTAILFFVGFLFINAYWILPQVYLAKTGFGEKLAAVGGIEGALAWEKTVGRSASFINLFRLQGMPNWYGGEHTYSSYFIENPLLIFLSFIPVTVIFLGLLYHRRFEKNARRDRLFYLILLIFLVGAVFTAGSHSPLGFVYVFLMKYVPGFAIFRTAFYKFAPAFWFTFIFLTGYYLNLFILKFVKKKVIFNTIGVLAITFILAYHFPYFIGNFFAWNKPFSTKVQVPEYVYEMADYVNKESKIDSRILVLPPLDQKFHADSYKWGFWSLDLLPRLSFNRSVIGNDVSFPPIVSGVYKAIESENEEAFSLLTRKIGIDAVLWRNDVLYDDKVTTSDNFAELESNLKEFSNITLLKEYGDWRLYGISTDTLPTLYAVGTIVETSSDKGVIDGLLYELADEISQTPGIIRSMDLDSMQSEKLNLLDKRKIIEAGCLYCSPGELTQAINEVSIPHIRFLPGSTFYPFIELKERWLLESVEDNPSEKVGVQLVLASKRLAEIEWLLALSSDEELQGLLNMSIKKYQEHINSAIEELSKLPEVDRNIKTINIYTYTRAHQRLWPFFAKLNRGSENSFQALFNYLEEKSSLLEKEMWVTRNPAVLKLVLDIEEEGLYKIITKGDTAESMIFGDSLLEDGDMVELESGIQKIKILLEQTKNQLEIDTPKGVFQPAKGEKYAIENFDFEDDYVISFKYKKRQGIPVKVVLSYDNDQIPSDESDPNLAKDLKYSSRWEEFSFKFTPAVGASEASISFLYKAFNDNEALLIDDLKVKKHVFTRIFLQQEKENTETAPPEVTSTRVNPGVYKIKITNATSPFLLVFGESFSKGWTLLKDDRKFEEAMHLPVNGYANGWLIESVGDQELELSFAPQKDFVTGLVISGVSLVGFLLLIVRPRRGMLRKDENR